MIQTFALCWNGNPDAIIGMSRKWLYLTRIYDQGEGKIVSLRLFYNFGRLWWQCQYGSGGDERGRLINRQLHHDTDWVISEKGYHCKFCGRLLREINPRLRKFCPHCENEFFSHYIQYDCWSWFRAKVFKRDRGHCVKCSKDIGNIYNSWVCDHIIPLSKGGKDWLEDPEMTNFQTLCDDCNKIKTVVDLSRLGRPKDLATQNPFHVSLSWLFEKPVNHQLEKFFAVNLA
jgi:hypothetical protein